MLPINLGAITLKQLETFVAVAERGSFRLAAEKLHRSQSTVSAQIQQLEQALGVLLFQRTTRHVELTSEGSRFLMHARRAFGELSGGVQDLQEMVAGKHGRISIACSPTVSGGWLPRLVAEFQTTYPGIHLHFREAHAYDVIEEVRNKNVDFGIAPLVDQEDAFDFRVLWEEDICAVVSRTFMPTMKSTVTWREVAKHPLLIMPTNSAIRRMVDQVISTMDLSTTSRFEVLHYHTLLGMAAAGLGIAILPRLALATVSHRNLRGLKIVSPQLRRSMSIVSVRGREFSPAATRFIKLMEKHI